MSPINIGVRVRRAALSGRSLHDLKLLCSLIGGTDLIIDTIGEAKKKRKGISTYKTHLTECVLHTLLDRVENKPSVHSLIYKDFMRRPY